jgi:hypothetical protein
MTMSTENSLIDAALRGWKSNVERVDKLFGTLSPEQLEQQVTLGKNRLIYLPPSRRKSSNGNRIGANSLCS